ncbi:aspartate dehydrogenase domain-containing protein [Turicimonas muris]|uniref:aspartate dehydrogenase domain-containing protein n=1 Tax=Turicimonas muris TaxID=1796652 RepID=UPI003339BC64
MVSEPGRASNEHIIRVRSETLNATLSFESKPDKANPKSSVSAALSVLALLKNLSSPIRYF